MALMAIAMMNEAAAISIVLRAMRLIIEHRLRCER
jgi:hypothetical protein